MAVATVAISLSACASSSRKANAPRPPAPILVSASISADGISASPRRFGAGPITLVVTNQTDRSQQITLQSAHARGGGGGVRQQTGPINPRDTASLDAEVARGRYTVHVSGHGIKPATLRVGARRPSSQNQLLLP